MIVGIAAVAFVVTVFFVKACWMNRKAGPAGSDGSVSGQESIDAARIGKMEPEEFGKELANGSGLAVIDLRDADSFQLAHVSGSKNVPLDQIASYADSFDKSKDYVLIDEKSDPKAINYAAKSLSGVRSLSYLDGGFSAWNNGFNPVVNDGDPASFADQSKVNYVSADDLKKWMETDPNLLLIDVRGSQDFAVDHLKGAVNIHADDLESSKNRIPFGKKIVVYDSDSLLAFKAAVRLYDLGIFNVYSLAEGLEVWKQKGYETVK